MKQIIAILVLLIVVVAFVFLLSSASKNIASSPRSSSFKFDFTPPIPENPVSFDNSRPLKADRETWGEISEKYGQLKFVKSESSFAVPYEKSAKYEYIVISASPSNNKPVKISGLSLHSVMTGKTIKIPRAVKIFQIGAENLLEDVYLEPGEKVIISSGKSPVYLSFRENICSYYLSRLKEFTPSIDRSYCPAVSDIIRVDVNFAKKYGDSCVDAVYSMDKCSYFLPNNPYYRKVSKKCRETLKNEFSYNACVRRYYDNQDFFNPKIWRLYLKQEKPIWKERYEIIRLLDEKGKTIDILSY